MQSEMMLRRLLFTCLTLTIGTFYCSSQTIILSEPGPFVYPSQDQIITDNYNVNVSTCTSFSFSLDYSFNEPWEGSGNMETPDECVGGFLACNGDPDNQTLDCDDCWDFLDVEATLDGSQIFYDIIGDVGTTDAEQSGTIAMPPICTDMTSLNIRVRNQCWSGTEEITYSNLVVVCYQAQPLVSTNAPICDGDDLDLMGSAVDETAVTNWQWTNSGPGSIDDAGAQNTFATGASGGETYILTTTDMNACTGSESVVVTLLPAPTANDPMIDGCSTQLSNYDLTAENGNVNATETVTWYTGQPSVGGTLISPATNADITGGDIWALVTDGNGCTTEVMITVTDNGGPTGSLSGQGTLCPGDCEPIVVTVSGGTPLYNIDLNLFGIASVSVPGFDVSGIVNVCYDNGGPPFDPATNTFNVPDPGLPFDVTIELSMTGIVDANNCFGTVSGGSVFITFEPGTDINSAGPMQECDDGSGQATFTLSDLDAQINGGSGDIVVYYTDPGGIDVIGSTITTGSTTIYAQVLGTCDSEIIPIELQVINNGDAGPVQLACNASDNDNCTLCNGSGGSIAVTLYTSFGSADVESFVLQTTNSTGSSTQTISPLSTDGTYPFTITENTTFEIILVNITGQCADASDLGGAVTFTIIDAPSFDDPGSLTGCGSVTLPAFTNVGAGTSPSYFEQPGGQGDEYPVGTTITTTSTIYAYAGGPGCELEYPVVITITQPAVLSPVSDVTECGSYILPAIQGLNIEDAGYFTGPAGSGTPLNVGDAITSTGTIYIYAPCGNSEVDFLVTINAGPTFDNTMAVACDFYVLPTITGTALTGNEAYYSATSGSGSNIMVGDTIFQDSTIYIYDPLPGCEQDIPFVIDIRQEQEAGNDTLLTICVGTDTDYDPFELLGPTADTTGFWINFITGDTIGDIELFNFQDSIAGVYDYIYAIEDTICGDDAAFVAFEISDASGVDLGPDINLSLCGVDMPTFLAAGMSYTAGGDWFEIKDGDTTALDFLTFPLENVVGMDSLLYILSSGDCGQDTALLTVEILPQETAGEDVATLVCAPAFVDMIPLLVGASMVGTFSEPPLQGAVVGNAFDSGAVTAGDYIVYHIVQNQQGCPPDTAVISVTVSAGPSAGTDVTHEVCNRNINLNDYIPTDADPGGIFLQGSDTIVGGLTTIMPGDNLLFTYQVGDGVNCQVRQSEIMMSFPDTPAAFYGIPLNFCLDECRPIRIIVEDVDTIYATITDGTTSFPLVIPIPPGDSTGIELCNLEDGIFDTTNLEPNTTYTFIQDSLYSAAFGCTFDSNIARDINTNKYEGTYTDSFCSDTTIVIGDMTFDMNNTSGVATIDGGGQFGCDSTVTVNITIEDVNFGTMSYSACAGLPFVDPDFGLTWTETNDQDDVVVQTASGCDSIVSVTVVFADEVVTPFPISICPGGSEMVLGVTFDESLLTDTINTGIQSVAGCDSLVAVSVIVDANTPAQLTGQVCADYEEEVVPGIIFNMQTLGDTAVVGLATNGCDSLVINGYDYTLGGTAGTFDTITCDLSYSLEVGSTVFDISNPNGMAPVAGSGSNGCDSTVTVSITYLDLTPVYEVVPGTCTEPGYVILQSYDNAGEPFLLPELPIELPLVSGDTVFLSQTVSDGCLVEEAIYVPTQGAADYQASEMDGQITIADNGTPIDSIVWTPSTGLSCTDCPDPVATPDVTTTYTAIIYHNDGCTDEVVITIEVDEPVPTIIDYYVPNVFNPVGSPANRIFRVIIPTLADGLVTSMNIYDRWGNLMYSSTDAALLSNGGGWDGSLNGSAVRAGVYVYAITILEADGNVITKVGDVTLVD